MHALITLLLAAGPAPVTYDTFLEEALFAGGARSQGELDRLVRLYHQRIDPIVAVVRGQPDEIAAKLLLKHLHYSYGGTDAVLKQYVTGHWSLNEALETGNYNCLSASTLFTLAAHQAGLDATGEIFPGHARAIVSIRGHVHQVEATSPYGFGEEDWFVRSEVDFKTGAVTLSVATPLQTGLAPLIEGAWVWADLQPDPRLANRVAAPAPPPPPPAFVAKQLSKPETPRRISADN